MMVRKLLPILRQEFKVTNFTFRWKSIDDFEQPVLKWFCGIKYVIFRWTLALYFITAMSISLALNVKDGWIFKLTSINYIAVTLYFLYAAASVSYRVWLRRKPSASKIALAGGHENAPDHENKDGISLSLKLHWLLYNIAVSYCTFITVAFWILLAPSRKGGYPPSMRTYLVLDRHGINLLLLIIDFLSNRIPFRILHFVYPSFVIGLYFVYNAIYWSITKKLVYGEILNYGSQPGMITGMVLGAVFICGPVIQILWFFAYLLKKRLTSTWKTDPNENCEMEGVN